MQSTHLQPQASLAGFRTYEQMTIEALNPALEGMPEEQVCYHIGWGSQNMPHTWDVPLDVPPADIVDPVLRVKDMETPEAFRRRVHPEPRPTARLPLATTRRARAQRERL
jgi:hypothetical protein